MPAVRRHPIQTKEKERAIMLDQVAILWAYLRARAGVCGGWNEAGTVVEKVILTAIFAALAIAVGAIIVDKVTTKANSINLN
jgi:hypothetical protein